MDSFKRDTSQDQHHPTMRPSGVLLWLILITAITLAACQPQTTANDAAPIAGDEDARLNAFLDEVFERKVLQSPIQQSYLGRQTDRLGEWDDFSDAYADQQITNTENDLARLRGSFSRDKLSANGKLSYDLFALDAARARETHSYRHQFYVVDQFNGQISSLITLLQNNHKIRSLNDAQDYITRVGGIKKVLLEHAAQLKDRAEIGVIPPAFAFPPMLADAHSMTSGVPLTDDAVEHPVLRDFKLKILALEISADERNALLQKLTAALRGPFKEGFELLIGEMEKLQPQAVTNGNKGVWSLPDGTAFYENRIRSHTTLNLTAAEIHDVGLAEVARIHDEMRVIQKTVDFTGTLQEFFEFIRNDPNNYYEDSDAGREQFLSDARKQISAINAVVGNYFNQVPKAGLEVRRVEPWRENSTSIAFYNQPSEDGTRPGVYYANLADMKSVQKYVFTAITYHESIPGHHFQIALAQELPTLPKFRKFGFYNAFTEGWALYAEQLAKEMGFYADPLHDFGRLQNELWRSVRLVVDTGIHAMRWTREQSIDYFISNTPLSKGDIVTEVERYFVNPGQALGYKMGMIKILELRDMAKRELGKAYDIREFHDAVIGAGELPLPILEQRVKQYVFAKKAGA